MALSPTLLKTLNTVTFIGTITTIVLNREFITKTVEDRPNFLSNSSIGYIIPAINWFLLAGFNLVQWFDFAHDVVVDAISWNLFVSNLVITSWVLTWRFDWLIVGQILLLINTVLVWRLHDKMRSFTATNLIDYAFVHISFSIYVGLAWLDVFQNFFAAFTTKEGGPESWAAIGATAAIFVLLAIGNYYTQFSMDPDSWSGSAIALMLLSIGFEQGNDVPIVQLASYISFGWLIGSLVSRVINNVNVWNQRDMDDIRVNNERRPLLG
ncbi:hypothetical protein BGZ76_001433 [Entomortierella beljakovae]|nr:hypothetical protein BGZ76_001433 [Entomortierella beljakovae]